MSQCRKRTSTSYTDYLIKSPIALLIIGILAIAIGIFFIFLQSENKPIPREEALAYSGEFKEYQTSKNYCGICFQDGHLYEVYPHTETGEFRKKMESLPKGIKLHILVNPNNQYVVEIKTDTEELLNFEKSQQDIDSYDNGYIAIGVLVCVCGAFLMLFAFGMKKNKRKEDQRHAKRKTKNGDSRIDSTPLRCADMSVKSRILLEAVVGNYNICYRRVKTVNELIVNNVVYDEKRALFEFEHKLCANIDKHEIEVGFDSDSYSYIKFDRKIINQKKRLI